MQSQGTKWRCPPISLVEADELPSSEFHAVASGGTQQPQPGAVGSICSSFSQKVTFKLVHKICFTSGSVKVFGYSKTDWLKSVQTNEFEVILYQCNIEEKLRTTYGRINYWKLENWHLNKTREGRDLKKKKISNALFIISSSRLWYLKV